MKGEKFGRVGPKTTYYSPITQAVNHSFNRTGVASRLINANKAKPIPPVPVKWDPFGGIPQGFKPLGKIPTPPHFSKTNAIVPKYNGFVKPGFNLGKSITGHFADMNAKPTNALGVVKKTTGMVNKLGAASMIWGIGDKLGNAIINKRAQNKIQTLTVTHSKAMKSTTPGVKYDATLKFQNNVSQVHAQAASQNARPFGIFNALIK